MPIRSSSLPRSVARAVRPERECLLAASLGLSLSVEPADLERVTARLTHKPPPGRTSPHGRVRVDSGPSQLTVVRKSRVMARPGRAAPRTAGRAVATLVKILLWVVAGSSGRQSGNPGAWFRPEARSLLLSFQDRDDVRGLFGGCGIVAHVLIDGARLQAPRL